MNSQWFKVTDPEGQSLWLRADQCSRVRLRDSNVNVKAESIIEGSFGIQAVKETVEMIMKVLSKC